MPATRRPISRAPLIAVAAGLSTTTGFAQTFTGLGFLPGRVTSTAAAISRDGQVVVGRSTLNLDSSQRAFRWTRAGGMIAIPMVSGGTSASAWAASGDGSVIAGEVDAPGPLAFRWDAAGGMQTIGTLAGATSTYAWAISDDGAAVAGTSGTRPFRWTAAGGMVDLGLLSGATGAGGALGISADGRSVAGQSNSPPGSGPIHSFRWTQETGMVDLGLLPPFPAARAYAISGDGTTVGGFCESGGTARVAFRWTAQAGMTDLGPPPPGFPYSYVMSLSYDGLVAAGYVELSSSQQHASMWSPATGLVDLNTYLPAHGVNLSGWVLYQALAISGDGLTIVGWGGHGTVTREAWVATLPAPCYPNCDSSTAAPALNVADFTCFLQRFAAADTWANCDASTAIPTLNIADFTCFLQNFAAGCP